MDLLFDAVEVELFSTDISKALNNLGSNGIKVTQVRYLNDLTVRLLMPRRDIKRLENTSKYVQKVKILNSRGVFPVLRTIAYRHILVATVALILLMSAFLPTRILFIDVEGNQTVPDNAILDQAHECGIRFGADRRAVRSERVKNDLLERMPQLKWAAVTTNGSTATIHVQEETPSEQITKQSVGHLVAACDGIVQSISVTRGTPMCSVGDAVTAGQLLVSGYTDCGLCIQATQAEGEIYARTLRSIRSAAIRPTNSRGQVIRQERRYSIQLGKKLIKLYKDSGISDATCVKIYARKCVNLPGGLELPVYIIQEQLQYFTPADDEMAWNPMWLAECTTRYISDQMLAGSILEHETELVAESDVCYLISSYACNEMIGLIKSEENIEQYAEDN